MRVIYGVWTGVLLGTGRAPRSVRREVGGWTDGRADGQADVRLSAANRLLRAEGGQSVTGPTRLGAHGSYVSITRQTRVRITQILPQYSQNSQGTTRTAV